MVLANFDALREESAPGVKVCLSLFRIWAVFSLMAAGTQALVGQTQKFMPSDQGTLMLVREWDAATGSLIGWLPRHSAAIQLELLDKSVDPHFDLEEAVYVRWPRRRHSEADERQILISPTPRTFEGQTWLPVKRDPNVVRIGKGVFLVRGFVLGDSKWRQPIRTATTSRNIANAKSLR
jgi:hypothetical protein